MLLRPGCFQERFAAPEHLGVLTPNAEPEHIFKA